MEDKYRTQLIQLLTPLVGVGNFTAEVQTDVNLDESQATRESYNKDGSALRAEQGNWTGTSKDGDGAAPGGIPGALSNTPPPASTMSAPSTQAPAANAVASTPGAAPAPAPAASPTPSVKQADSFARTYDLGKEVSVTRAVPGNVKRLSVAILLREESGKPRGKVEIDQITQLVQAAVGFDPNRGDQVTVISRKFTGGADADAAGGPAWYDASWVSLFARNGTALLIALLVLFLGVRPLSKALLKKRDDASPHRPALAIAGGNQPQQQQEQMAPVSIDMLQNGGKSYDDRVGLVRGFTRDNPARAALAVRDMIKADAQ
jgi:flagellar M-ring protein FliF